MYHQEGKYEKHLNDIKNILEHSYEIINVGFIKKKVTEYRLSDSWKWVSAS